jgi:polysaccharide export outer membrane protein
MRGTRFAGWQRREVMMGPHGKRQSIPARLLAGLLLLLMAAAPGLSSGQEASGATPRQEGSLEPPGYTIGPEDVLHISVWKSDATSRTVPVRPDGRISLPLVNEVQAAGLTPMQLRDVLTGKLREFMPFPEVSVIVQEVNSFKVSVMGEVVRPDTYTLKRWATVLDVLALAGGFTPVASRSRILILRPEGKTIKRILFNYTKLITAEGEQENFYLRPGDIILVP